MLTQDGDRRLRDFSKKNAGETITEVTKGVWFATGLGHSNAIFIEADSSVILIDTLDTLERGEKLLRIIRQKTEKEIKTVIYTHCHPDHRGGAGAFLESKPEIIAFEPKSPPFAQAELLQNIQSLRGARQFGYSLTDERAVSQGIGIREGIAYGERRAFVPPTTVYHQDKVVREIDGVLLEMVRLPGETDDQIMIWLEQRGTLCCGDNYYGCFPNLYAIRGGQYRDLAAWMNSLGVILSYPAEHLLPGHTAAIAGRAEIKTVLENFKNAFAYILTQTLRGMDAGKSAEQLASEIKLPPEFADLPYLAEHYGCVEWTVRAIYTAYLGWFDGNPTHLHPMSPVKYSEKMVALIGGAPSVLKEAENALRQGEYPWCLELCDLLLSGPQTACREAPRLKAAALERLAEYETSANGRHYYFTCAEELNAQGS